jgi:glycosyltransferase involved in cell wall biosynthesis
MRLALIGAFPFPLLQGSQVYLAGQANALETAGAECERLTYASLPPLLAPAHARSGPSFKKPLADAALTTALIAAHRRQPFDVVLAHNSEAAVAAILARATIRVPVVYVAHTILRYELSAYGPSRWRPALDRIGSAIDGWITRRSDGIIALSEDARSLLASKAHCAIAVIAPGLDDTPAPDAEMRRRVCQSANLSPGGFTLYAGNLDVYQDLDLLDAAASLSGTDRLPIVVATHDARDGSSRYPNLRIIELDAFDEVRALHFAAQSLVLTRRRRGGFPIKLLNYMEAGRPIVAFGRIAPGLEDGVSACLLDDDAGPEQLSRALRMLAAQPGLAASLGAAARKQLCDRHRWPRLAEQTLRFVDSVRRSPGR